MAQSYRDLTVWQRAMEMTVKVYEVTASFPRVEIYGLISQLRRASVSVASNIAEGRGRISTGEFKQFLGTAQGSKLRSANATRGWAKIGAWKRGLTESGFESER